MCSRGVAFVAIGSGVGCLLDYQLHTPVACTIYPAENEVLWYFLEAKNLSKKQMIVVYERCDYRNLVTDYILEMGKHVELLKLILNLQKGNPFSIFSLKLWPSK
ncbi:hypothetical protein NC652_016920 [Populus alba x Populus x berolinensis]|nr:hypothetical protein NC652_016920 [Populus alba x Populus x berolinensis]